MGRELSGILRGVLIPSVSTKNIGAWGFQKYTSGNIRWPVIRKRNELGDAQALIEGME